MRPLLDLAAPIVPGRSLAGLEIGRSVVEYGDLLLAADSYNGDNSDWKHIFSLWEARYRFGQVYEWTNWEFFKSTRSLGKIRRRQRRGKPPGDLFVPEAPDPGPPAVELAVDLRDGLVFALHALGGYKGKLFDSLSVGMTGAEALEFETRIRYEEQEGALMVADEPGVLLTLEPYGWDLEPEDVRVATIGEIWVYDHHRAPGGVLFTSPPEIHHE
jgi:hypothetical protein